MSRFLKNSACKFANGAVARAYVEMFNQLGGDIKREYFKEHKGIHHDKGGLFDGADYCDFYF